MTPTLNSLFIRAGEFWFVSNEVGEEDGDMRSKVVREEDRVTPPLHGWQYWNRFDGKWKSDKTLLCSREVSSACREVRVDKLARLIVIWIFNK